MRFPVIQGPFGGGYSSTRLLAAVSNGGGLGSYGAHVLTPAEIREMGAEAHQLAPGKPFGINLWVDLSDGPVSREEFEARLPRFAPIYEELGIPLPEYPGPAGYTFEEQVEAVLEARPAVFSFVFGISSAEILAECGRRGILTVGAATTLDEALALEEAGVDALVATGFEAGGHRPSFLRAAEDSLHGTLALTRQVVEAVRVPVIAAGGIADGAGVAAVLRLGAAAAQVGTAFLACEESGASQLQREVLFSKDARYTRLTRQVSGRLARFLDTRLLQRLEGMGLPPLRYPVQGNLTAPIKRAAARVEDGVLYAGQGAPLIRHRRAGELLEALAREL
jgi:nitronate monooxygenase